MIKKSYAWAAFAMIALAFLAIELGSYSYSASNENAYYKMGQLIASGEMPYKDFFFAHQPLQVYVYALIFKLFGFNLGILKFISAAAAVITALFIFKILEQKSETAAIIGAALFLFSQSVLLFSGYPTGMEFVMLFSTAGLYFFLTGRSATSGVFFGLGVISGLLAVIPAAVIGLWLLIKELGELRRFIAGFAALVLPVTIGFTLLSGGEYIRQILVYNLLKPEGVVNHWETIISILKANWLVFAAALTVVFAAGKLSSKVLVPVMITGLFGVAFSFMKIVFDYYFMAIVPFVVIAASQGLDGLVDSLKLRKILAYGALALVIGIFSLLNYTSFVSNDFYDFPMARDAALFVKDNSDRSNTIFGEDATTPLISILSEREITLNYVDSNDLRFRTSLEKPTEVISKLKAGNLKFFLVRRLDFGNGVQLDYGVATIPEFAEFLNTDCRIAKEFAYPWRGFEKRYIIYDCSRSA